ncbi:MAG TPA: tripartite tricarboxylate transporter substrate-binding protein [Hyphomicrobiaceae bacterium]|nr:tripartite tricarboxylate transporter substrate-binding protein [Hyphomicrobiaceae bacterium]
MRRTLIASALVGCALSLPALSSAHAQSDFYKGKTVQVVIGAKSGSLAVAAQIVAQHLGKHIPGNPNVIFVSMPGGAHLGATNHVFNVAEADGLTILAANPNVAMSQLAKLEQVRFDIRKFEWLGSSGSDGAMFAIRADLPYKTAKDLKDAGKELIVGTTGPGSNAHDMPLLLKEFAGFKFKLVSGYAANSDILLAVERKEVDGWSALATTVKNGIDRGAVRAIIRARAPVTGFNDLPVDESLTNDPIGKSLMAIRGIPLQIGRAFAVRPGTPKDRIEVLRAAFAKTMADPDLKAAMEKAKIETAYISPQDVTKGFDEMFNQSPQVLEAMGKYLKPGD